MINEQLDGRKVTVKVRGRARGFVEKASSTRVLDSTHASGGCSRKLLEATRLDSTPQLLAHRQLATQAHMY
jgi:hypothetical protein